MANLQKLIDLEGLSYFLGQIKAKFVRSVNHIKPDSNGNINIANMTGATYNSSGRAGLAPIPAAGKQDMALCGDATYKVLPISGGGTGQTTVAGVRYVLGLGNTNGALPIANGGTGATTAAAACKNLGAVRSVNGVSADDNSNVTLDLKNTLGLPNYASYVQISEGDFTPSTNGWLRLNLTSASDNRSFTVKHKSSGNIILQYGYGKYPGYGLFMCPVIAGETYTIYSSETQIYFHKVRG